MVRIFMHKAVHGILTLVMLFLAYSFGDGLPTFSTSISYSEMAAIMSEHYWSVACAAIGAAGLATTFTNNWKLRMVSAGILGAGHFVISILIFLGNRHAIGTGLFFGYGALGLGLAYSTAHLGERIAEDLDPFDIP